MLALFDLQFTPKTAVCASNFAFIACDSYPHSFKRSPKLFYSFAVIEKINNIVIYITQSTAGGVFYSNIKQPMNKLSDSVLYIEVFVSMLHDIF